MAREPRGYVYFVHCPTTQMVKIGWSINHPDGRLAMFRLGSAASLDRMGYIRNDQTLERRLHVQFKHLREHGEWFRLEADLLEYIEENAQPWRMMKRSSPEDHEQRRTIWESYDETATKLMWEWTEKHCDGFSRNPEPEYVDFFEFCLQRGFRFRKPDRVIFKMVNGKLKRGYYKYTD